jgi:hypothetical protein
VSFCNQDLALEDNGREIMKKISLFTALVLSLAINAYAIHPASVEVEEEKKEKQPATTKHYEGSLHSMMDNGEFSVEILLPDSGLEMGVNKIDLILHDKGDKDVPGANITVTPWMPEMDHGVSEPPTVQEKGGGLYIVEDLTFTMTGKWELRLKIVKGDIEDTAVIALPMVGAMGHMHDMKTPDMDMIDTATEKKSKNGLFEVSYESKVTPIPLNRIISWELEVETVGDRKVENANITIVGDMPEHGHGFPTVPEVTEYLGDGKYLVEGLKFSMPGWWVVNFHIMDKDIMDSVSFNLIVE